MQRPNEFGRSRESGMTTEEGPIAGRRWLHGAISGLTQVRVTLVALLAADVVYRVAIRSHVRRAIGI